MVEYDDLLIGRIDAIDFNNFYGTTPGGVNEKKAISCIKYVIEHILRWDEETAVKKFDEHIINVMKLDKIISYIDFPIEVPYGNARYILSLIYPHRIKLNQQQLVEETFMKVLESDGKQFPRDYFAGGQGFKRFCICIKFLLENYKVFSSLDDIYKFFTSADGRTFLYTYRLKTPAYQFNINMLEVIRNITQNHPDGQLYYSYYSFQKAYKKLLNTDKQSEDIDDENDDIDE